MESETFTELWDWSCFLDLMKQLSNIDQHHSRVLSDIRWCGIQILSIALKLGYEATTKWSSGSEETFACLLRFGPNLGVFCNITKSTCTSFMLLLSFADGKIFVRMYPWRKLACILSYLRKIWILKA